MEIIFLGTAVMKPSEKRNQNAILLKRDAENILIDCGEGTQRQFRIARESPCKLTRLLITHWHGDHVLGISGLLQTMAQSEYNKTLYIYGPMGTKKYFGEIMNLFHFAGNIKTVITEIVNDGTFYENEDFALEAFRVKHSCPSLAYAFIEKEKTRINKEKLKKLKIPSGPLIGELQKGKDITIDGKKIKAKDITYKQEGKKIAFMMDTVPCEGCLKVAKNANLLIAESTFLDDLKEKAQETLHMTAKQTAEIAKKSNVKKLILTHISERYERNLNIVLKEAKKTFKNSELAKDFMRIKI